MILIYIPFFIFFIGIIWLVCVLFPDRFNGDIRDWNRNFRREDIRRKRRERKKEKKSLKREFKKRIVLQDHPENEKEKNLSRTTNQKPAPQEFEAKQKLPALKPNKKKWELLTVAFGIQKGVSKNEIKVGEEISPFTYEIPVVPKPHSDFPSVFAQITPLNGVCRVFAKTKLISPVDIYGIDAYILFEKLINQLSKKYKKPTRKIDNLKSRAKIINKYKGKMNAFEDIQCYARWSFNNTQRKRNAISLPNDLTDIELSFNPADNVDDKKYFFYMNYVYDNYDLAILEVENMEKNALEEKNNMDENAL